MKLRKHPVLLAIVSTFVLVIVVAGIYGTWLAGSAGMLPWQPEPTRIAVTPFADIPGFSEPAATPTAIAQTD